MDPPTATIRRGERLTFTPTVTLADAGTDNGLVWSTTGGFVEGGEYTAPLTGGTYYVVAKNVWDPGAQGVATVTVKGVDVLVTPSVARLLPSGTVDFSATVLGSTLGQVAWSIREGAGTTNGTISAQGRYTAPTGVIATSIHVRATSVADPTVTTEAEVFVKTNDRIEVAVHPAETILETGEVLKFTAELANRLESESANVTWALEPIEGESTGGAILTGDAVIAGADPGRFLIRATSVADPTRSETAEVRVIETAPTTLVGIVRAATGTTITGTQAVTVASAIPNGPATTRQGPGQFRLRGIDATAISTSNPLLLAGFVDDGTGEMRATNAAWGLEERTSAPMSPTLDLAAPAIPGSLAIPTPTLSQVGADPDTSHNASASSSVLRVLVMDPSGDEWPQLGGAVAPSVSGVEVQLTSDGDTTFSSPIGSIVSPLWPFSGADFGGLTADTRYRFHARYLRNSTPGAWSTAATARTRTTGSAPAGTHSVSGTITFAGPTVASSARVSVLLYSRERVTDEGALPIRLTAGSMVDYTLLGVPDGAYRPVVLLDLDADGAIEVGDRQWIGQEMLWVRGSNVTDFDLTVGVERSREFFSVHAIEPVSGSRTEVAELAAMSAGVGVARSSVLELSPSIASLWKTPTDLPLPWAQPVRLLSGSPASGAFVAPGSNILVNTLHRDGVTTSARVPVSGPPEPIAGLSLAISGSPKQFSASWTATSGVALTYVLGHELRLYLVAGGTRTLVDRVVVANNASSASGSATLSTPGVYELDFVTHDALGNTTTKRVRNGIAPAAPSISNFGTTLVSGTRRYFVQWTPASSGDLALTQNYDVKFCKLSGGTCITASPNQPEEFNALAKTTTSVTGTTFSGFTGGDFKVFLTVRDNYGNTNTTSALNGAPPPTPTITFFTSTPVSGTRRFSATWNAPSPTNLALTGGYELKFCKLSAGVCIDAGGEHPEIVTGIAASAVQGNGSTYTVTASQDYRAELTVKDLFGNPGTSDTEDSYEPAALTGVTGGIDTVNGTLEVSWTSASSTDRGVTEKYTARYYESDGTTLIGEQFTTNTSVLYLPGPTTPAAGTYKVKVVTHDHFLNEISSALATITVPP